jgi:superfamily II DNA or RNA helicase
MTNYLQDNFTLYPWQQECLARWFERGSRGIVAAVTGSGKTRLAVHAAIKLREGLAARGEALSIRVAVPKTFLLSHWRAAFLRENIASREDIGLWCGTHKDEPTRAITLYVLNSARYAMARHILADIRAGRHMLLIVDECHHLMGKKNAKILEFLPKLGDGAGRYHVLALSATAEAVARDKQLAAALGGVIYRYELSQALRDGVVSEFMLLPVSVSFTDDESGEYDTLSLRLAKAVTEVKKLHPALRGAAGADFFAALQALAGEKSRLGNAASLVLRLAYSRREMMHLAENRILCACELTLRQPPESKIILFGERIACARRIQRILEKALPGQTAIYHSDLGSEAMKSNLSRYQSGEARILITCRALDEGLDVPETDVGIAVSSTKTERQRVQRLGRILRKSGSPLPAKLYYIYLEWSSEESIYLERDFPFPITPLSFHGDGGGFYSDEFEALADAALTRASEQAARPERRQELHNQMGLCLARGDFALPAALCETMRGRAQTQSERNYWTVALLLARAGEEDQAKMKQSTE